jgi:catechol 2,3-dioxygenase-like lactoylglutathione lyase family enzyme
VRAILFVTDVARMQAFYESVLGLSVTSSEPGYVELGELALHAIPEHYAPAISSPPELREDAITKLAFHVDDVAAERARLVDLGVAMRELSHYKAFSFCDGIDPEGNVFQITSR